MTIYCQSDHHEGSSTVHSEFGLQKPCERIDEQANKFLEQLIDLAMCSNGM